MSHHNYLKMRDFSSSHNFMEVENGTQKEDKFNLQRGPGVHGNHGLLEKEYRINIGVTSSSRGSIFQFRGIQTHADSHVKILIPEGTLRPLISDRKFLGIKTILAYIRLIMSFDSVVSGFLLAVCCMVLCMGFGSHQTDVEKNIMSTALKTDLTDGVHGIDVGGSVF